MPASLVTVCHGKCFFGMKENFSDNLKLVIIWGRLNCQGVRKLPNFLCRPTRLVKTVTVLLPISHSRDFSRLCLLSLAISLVYASASRFLTSVPPSASRPDGDGDDDGVEMARQAAFVVARSGARGGSWRRDWSFFFFSLLFLVVFWLQEGGCEIAVCRRLSGGGDGSTTKVRRRRGGTRRWRES
ncbi:hypothetical protein LR48_Vigan181s003700 [Vigna angularis]|uniref:Uncharacterized protein n=1 Tax=Phaseolus angularis TaxID=3914 RepID=A0A0L9T6L8_PHAAN|nr:hypothetical protein LR48_Vigan181s003700 [Vigna angularis]